MRLRFVLAFRHLDTRHPRIGRQRQAELLGRRLAEIDSIALEGNFVIRFWIDIVRFSAGWNKTDLENLLDQRVEILQADDAGLRHLGMKRTTRQHVVPSLADQVECA